MNGDRESRRFEPTPTRKARAVRDGNIARSNDVAVTASFACALVGAMLVLPFIGSAWSRALRELAARPSLASVPPLLDLVLAAAFVPAAGAAAGAVGAGIAQAGGLRLRFPAPKLSHLNPVAGLKRMLGAEAFVGGLRALAAFSCACAALVPIGQELAARAAVIVGPESFAAFARSGAERACWAVLAVGALFAVADYALARRRWLRQLRMTLDELKRDQKENDGDPQARSRRRAMHRALAHGAVARTREASFVVVNPTHLAIAIRYAPPEVPVPEILVRAADETALAVKALARECGIPIVENVALARALFASGEADRPIPSAAYVATARVIAELARAGVLA